MFRLKGFKQIVNKPTHNSGTIIYCLIDIYHISVKQWYIYDEYDIVHPNLCKILSLKCRSTQTSEINVSLALCQILRVMST